MFVLEYDCVQRSLRVGLLDSAYVCLVVVWVGLEVPSVDRVIFLGGACVRFLMYEYGTSVVVKGSEHCRIGQYGGCCILLS